MPYNSHGPVGGEVLNVVWRKKENHRKQNHQHTKKWDDYINNHPEANKEDILKQRDIIEEDIWNNLGDVPLQ